LSALLFTHLASGGGASMNVTMSLPEDAFDTLRDVIVENNVLRRISSPSRIDGIFFSNNMGISWVVFVRWLGGTVKLTDECSFGVFFELEMRHLIRVAPSFYKKDQKKQHRKTPCSNPHSSTSIKALVFNIVDASHSAICIATLATILVTTSKSKVGGAFNTIVFNELNSKALKGFYRTSPEYFGFDIAPHFNFSFEFSAGKRITRSSATGSD
jgi:hypothetical protein